MTSFQEFVRKWGKILFWKQSVLAELFCSSEENSSMVYNWAHVLLDAILLFFRRKTNFWMKWLFKRHSIFTEQLWYRKELLLFKRCFRSSKTIIHQLHIWTNTFSNIVSRQGQALSPYVPDVNSARKFRRRSYVRRFVWYIVRGD